MKMSNRYSPEMIQDIWKDSDEALDRVSTDMAEALIARMRSVNNGAVINLGDNRLNELRTELVENYRNQFATAGS
ncbi:MAG: hypothetical protein COA53_09025 [Rhodobacteraceae bacterium]|nr:MAG: hypothetical protein COA53_09025 [Paracoccaceae bacterium]